MKKTIKLLIYLILLSILAINIYTIYNRLILKKNIVKIFGFANLLIISGSMEPAIYVNDMIIIKEEKDYYKDDIVTYKTDRSLITHRIVDIKENEIYLKGDNNNVADEPILKDKIAGKVILIIPKIGYFIQFITSKIGIILLVIIGFFIIKPKKNIKRGKDEKG